MPINTPEQNAIQSAYLPHRLRPSLACVGRCRRRCRRCDHGWTFPRVRGPLPENIVSGCRVVDRPSRAWAAVTHGAGDSTGARPSLACVGRCVEVPALRSPTRTVPRVRGPLTWTSVICSVREDRPSRAWAAG